MVKEAAHQHQNQKEQIKNFFSKNTAESLKSDEILDTKFAQHASVGRHHAEPAITQLHSVTENDKDTVNEKTQDKKPQRLEFSITTDLTTNDFLFLNDLKLNRKLLSKKERIRTKDRPTTAQVLNSVNEVLLKQTKEQSMSENETMEEGEPIDSYELITVEEIRTDQTSSQEETSLETVIKSENDTQKELDKHMDAAQKEEKDPSSLDKQMDATQKEEKDQSYLDKQMDANIDEIETLPKTMDENCASNEGHSEDLVKDEVELKSLPSYSGLNAKVQKIVASSTWWEVHGYDLCKIITSISLVPLCLGLLKQGEIWQMVIATAILGMIYSMVSIKGGHSALHGSLVGSTHKWLSCLLLEFFGSYSHYMASNTHIDFHHPYTNIIGLGDSSTWKVPFVPRFLYLFILPLFLPVLTPFVAAYQLLAEEKLYKEFVKFLTVCFAGYAFHLYIFTHYAGFTLTGAFTYIHVYRALSQPSYIHFNIFQHIGLPMYSPKHKPTSRVYLMSRGVLNIERNFLLDLVFGHSLINCHVEHHLFPRLSDNMCMKIKPVVSSYLKENGLRYNEDSYMNRLKDFYHRYDELMVHAPPITHFVGIQ